MNLSHHPCFNDKARHAFGRVHLPVAPRCNIQCRFCSRKYDCVNESRPGVTSGVLSPAQALAYLNAVVSKKPNISVVGIAGPGDPFANPRETMETLRRVRQAYPDMLLCVATNGLHLAPHIEELARLRVSHVTVTVNAVDPAVSEKIYAWVRFDRRVLPPREGGNVLLRQQMEAIACLKQNGVTVKVNAIIIPGVNDAHIPEIARKMAEMQVDILNCVPYYPNDGAAFKDVPEPSGELVQRVRKEAARFLPQMHHCTRCRADAVGLLGEDMPEEILQLLKTCETAPQPSGENKSPAAPYVAVASLEGVLVNQHLGEARQLLIYGLKNGGAALMETRRVPEPGGGAKRWEMLAEIIRDCRALLVSGIGANPRETLVREGIEVFEVEGLIADAVQSVYDGKSLRAFIKRKPTVCGAACGGGGAGCG